MRNPFSGLELTEYLKDNVPLDTIVCIAMKPDAFRFVGGALRELAKIGGSVVSMPSSGGSLAILGYKGNETKPWMKVVQNGKGLGPSKIDYHLRLPKLPSVDIKLISQACQDRGIDMTKGTCGKASIYVKGTQRAKQGRGYNIVAVDYETGQVTNSSSFDVSSGPGECKKLADFVNKIPKDFIVLIAVQDTAGKWTSTDLFSAFKSVGMRFTIRLENQSFIQLGYKGDRPVNWIQEKSSPAGKGPTQLSVRILLPVKPTAITNKYNVTMSTTRAPITSYPQQGSCGISQVNSARIVKGERAKPGKWPWQAGIYEKGRKRIGCGATLLNSQWVLTSAQCMPGKDGHVVLGDHNRTKIEGTEQIFNISTFIRHWRYFSGGAHNNDVALLKLSRPAIMTRYVRPVCLPQPFEDIPTNTSCYITGWGKRRFARPRTKVLHQAKVLIRQNSVCQERLSSGRFSSMLNMTTNMICLTGQSSNMVSGCHGDGGGPVVCRGPSGRFVLQGILSWGSPICHTADLYTVATKVSMYRHWIEKKILNYDKNKGR